MASLGDTLLVRCCACVIYSEAQWKLLEGHCLLQANELAPGMVFLSCTIMCDVQEDNKENLNYFFFFLIKANGFVKMATSGSESFLKPSIIS